MENQVPLAWIPRHKSIVGNELANHMAKEASAIKPIGPGPFLAIGSHKFREELRKVE